MNNNCIITKDNETEMLRIEINNKCVFEGNYWDFNRPKDIIELL